MQGVLVEGQGVEINGKSISRKKSNFLVPFTSAQAIPIANDQANVNCIVRVSFLKSLIVAGIILWDKATQLYHLFNFQ